MCLGTAAAVSFGTPAKAAENPQTSVSNTGKEAEVSNNQTSKAELVSDPYEGTGKTSKTLQGLIESEKNIKSLKPSSVIGSDERVRISGTTSFPYRATVQLSIKYPNTSSTYGCTGFLVNPNTVVTAGHCVYSQDHGWASSITSLRRAAMVHRIHTALIPARCFTPLKDGRKAKIPIMITVQ